MERVLDRRTENTGGQRALVITESRIQLLQAFNHG